MYWAIIHLQAHKQLKNNSCSAAQYTPIILMVCMRQHY